LVEKNKLNKQVSEFYQKDTWRKMKFRQYSYGKKSIDNFLNKIQETFGSNILIGYGNWSRDTQMKHFMPTMNKGLIFITPRKSCGFSRGLLVFIRDHTWSRIKIMSFPVACRLKPK
jgi:hypothetical protein